MSRLQKVLGALIRPAVKRRAKNRTLLEIAEHLEASRSRIVSRASGVADTPGNREAMNHIVGIERWGQNRLASALGSPLQIDSYRHYRLEEGSDMEALLAAFEETRTRTIALARELAEAGVGQTRTVPHNDVGELTATEWLVYLEDHANREARRIRGRSRRWFSGGR